MSGGMFAGQLDAFSVAAPSVAVGSFGKVLPVTSSVARRCCMLWHYSDRFPTSVRWAWGLVRERETVGVVTFSVPASPWVSVSATGERDQIMELSRLALRDNRKNEASWFVARALKLLGHRYTGLLVSYADAGHAHHGGVYQALGFHYGGSSDARTDIATDGGRHPRHHGGDPTQRQDRSAKYRYWLSIPRGRYDESCLWPSLPYPKPDADV